MVEESEDLFLDDEVDSVVTEAMVISSEPTVLEAEIVESSGIGLKAMFQGIMQNFSRAFTSVTLFAGSIGGAARSKVSDLRQERKENVERATAVREVKASSEAIVMVASEIQSYEWDLLGMDCLDCAMKATRAVSRIDGVESCNVSVMDGNIRVKIDVSKTNSSRLARVLSSIGYAPNLPWEVIQGVTPRMVENTRTIDRRTLRRELLQVPGILDLQMVEGRIEIKRVNQIQTSSDLLAGLREILGVDPVLVMGSNRSLRPDQWRLLGALATIPIIGVIMFLEYRDMATIAEVVAFVSVFIVGWSMMSEAFNSILNRILAFQVLTTAAVVGALVLQEYVEALMVVGLVSFASHLEERAIVKARELMQGGLDRLPREARLVNEKKATSKFMPFTEITESKLSINVQPINASHSFSPTNIVPVDTLQIGDQVEVRSGETVPVDGRIVEGLGYIDRAPLTGESLPVEISLGDFVEAGLTLTRGPLVIETTALEDETRLAGLIDMVRAFRESPPSVQTTIETFTKWWVPMVLFGAPIIAWIAYGVSEQTILTTLLLWVVSCPCALLLASPIPHAAALSHASSQGIVARGGDVLEKTAQVDLVLLDKTGTLTSGRPRLHSIVTTKGSEVERSLRLAAGLEVRSNHPYAEVILSSLPDGDSPMSVKSLKDGDAGVYGLFRSKPVIIGRADWLQSQGVDITSDFDQAIRNASEEGHGVSILAEDGTAIALFRFVHDDPREGAQELVTSLKRAGIVVEILSGDEQSSVEVFGRILGLDAKHCTGNVTPEEKTSFVQKRSVARHTLMAGDGFNDAGALAVADVGIAVGSGDQVNLEAADVLIPGENPCAILTLTRLARSARRIVRLNIGISLALTMTLVAIVLSGVEISIAVGVLLHEASALFVILNGMWVAGSGIQRFTTVIDIFRDVAKDTLEAIGILIGSRVNSGATD
ncbi:MAG: heavy metal translocating P-type ATPase [Candidatus Thalassarchaeaceae archaeon]